MGTVLGPLRKELHTASWDSKSSLHNGRGLAVSVGPSHPTHIMCPRPFHPDTVRSVCRLHNSVDVNKAPLQLLGSVQCAPHSFGVMSLLIRVLDIEAWLHRDAAMMPPIASQRRPAMGFCASSFTSWSSLHRRRLSQAKIDSETTARQLENSNFHCRMCSPSHTPSHPISITCT